MKAKCPKCGSKDYETTYHSPDYEWRINNHYCSPAKEHLHLVCNNCEYDWTIPTLDKKAKKA